MRCERLLGDAVAVQVKTLNDVLRPLVDVESRDDIAAVSDDLRSHLYTAEALGLIDLFEVPGALANQLIAEFAMREERNQRCRFLDRDMIFEVFGLEVVIAADGDAFHLLALSFGHLINEGAACLLLRRASIDGDVEETFGLEI